MPMSFPDFESLKKEAKGNKFRLPNEDEKEGNYREALHRYMLLKDRVESFEILFGVAQDKWSPEQKAKFIGLPMGDMQFNKNFIEQPFEVVK